MLVGGVCSSETPQELEKMQEFPDIEMCLYAASLTYNKIIIGKDRFVSKCLAVPDKEKS